MTKLEFILFVAAALKSGSAAVIAYHVWQYRNGGKFVQMFCLLLAGVAVSSLGVALVLCTGQDRATFNNDAVAIIYAISQLFAGGTIWAFLVYVLSPIKKKGDPVQSTKTKDDNTK
jgi:ABC-type Fe3+-siderophore transport system permease subunit